MTNIPTNRDQFERKSTDPGKEGAGIQASSFGGLNTVSNPLSIPYEDSPLLLNASVNVSGSIEKRKGSRVLLYENTAAKGITIIPTTTVLGYSYQVVKNGKDIQIMELNDDRLTLRMTKANVWTNAVENVKATYVSTNEAEQRLILCTGFNVPVQLTFTESRTLVNTSAGQTIVNIPNAERLATTNTNNVLCYVDGVIRSATYSYNSTSKILTITFDQGLTAGNRVIDIELITWQWWSEAQFYYGDRFFDTATRFNDKPTDRHIAIPENLRDGIDPLPGFPNLFPISVLGFNRPNYFYYTPNSSRLPLGVYQYAFSDGTITQPVNNWWTGNATNGQTLFTMPTSQAEWYGANTSNTVATFNNNQVSISSISYNGTVLSVTLSTGVVPSGQTDTLQVMLNPAPIVPAPFFLTFGTIQPGNTGRQDTLYMSRARILPFNGGLGVTGQNLYVRRDDIVQAQYTGGGVSNYGDYQLFNYQQGYGALMTQTALATFIDFTGGPEAGVPSNARIKIVNKEVSQYVGSNALSTNVSRSDGSWVPCYGLSSYANYATGSFPRNVALFQGRLIFSGFPQNPLIVALSSSTDSTVPGEYYASFQIDAFTDKPQDPLDVLISGLADDYVTGLAEHQGSLFVFTRKTVYRVSTTGRGTVTADNVAVSSVASIGIPNPQCLVKAEDSLLFMSDEGVYIITNGSSAQEATEYRLDELSTKVRNKFGSTKNPQKRALAWVSFDNNNKVLYVALPRKEDTSVASQILTFDTFRQAWSEIDTPGRFNTLSGATCVDVVNQSAFILVVSRAMSNGSPLDTTYLKMGDRRYMDFVVTGTATGSAQTFALPRLPYNTFTTRPGVRDYKITFPLLPLNDVQDITVTLDGSLLVFGSDYVKLNNNAVRVTADQGNGRSLVVTHRRPDTDYYSGQIRYNTQTALDLSHACVYEDNVVGLEGTDFTVSHSSTQTTVTLTAVANTIIEVGQVYTTVYATPLFTWNTLQRYKRLLYWLGFFDNTVSTDVYTETDVNITSGQDAEQIIGMPKTRLDCNISFVYNSQDNGDTSADLYGFEQLVWDAGMLDVYLPLQTDDYVLLKQALQGIGYSFQGIVWSTDEASFRMSGYQLDGKMKGTKYSHWSS